MSELKRFYKGRAKKPDLFGYDDDGNLIEKNKEGTVIKTITLPNYRRPTLEEYDEMEEKRTQNIATATKEFEDARRELRDVIFKPDTQESEVLRVNRKVVEADIKLQSARFPLRYVSVADSIMIKDIDFSKSFEKRKYPYSFVFLEERPFTLQEQYVRIGKAPEKPLVSLAEAKAAEDLAVPVILFADSETNEYGYMALDWAVQLEFNGIMYISAKQAIAGEIAKSFNDQENLQKIMLAESSDEISYSVENVPGETETNEIKWNDLTKQLIYDINIAKFNQYPELAARLLETKGAQLGAYIPNDNLIGIGISIDNVQSLNPINWTGQNLLGKALMDIRNKMRTERELISQQEAPTVAPVQKRKKPGVSLSVPSGDQVAVSVPRTIRRRPQVSTQVAPAETKVDEQTIYR
jgi:ribA/ribD-fused uncharacterized protein